MAMEEYGYYCTLKSIPFSEAKDKVVHALEAEGFGVLTEIDLRVTLKKKLGVDFRNYLILGACNPKLAKRALEAEAHAGLLLPCNVVLQDRMGAEGVVVSFQNPTALAAPTHNPELIAVAHEADVHILKVLVALGGNVPLGKEAKLEDVTPRDPGQYPARGLKARLDADRDRLTDVKDHSSSEGFLAKE